MVTGNPPAKPGTSRQVSGPIRPRVSKAPLVSAGRGETRRGKTREQWGQSQVQGQDVCKSEKHQTGKHQEAEWPREGQRSRLAPDPPPPPISPHLPLAQRFGAAKVKNGNPWPGDRLGTKIESEVFASRPVAGRNIQLYRDQKVLSRLPIFS